MFRVLTVVAMLGILLVTALLVIDKKYETRQLFSKIQKQEKLLDDYQVEWGQLQLELSMLAEGNRVERVAKEKLKLIMPERESIIYLKP